MDKYESFTAISARVMCQRYWCAKQAQLYCDKCNQVQYCSRSCMNDDIPGHSIICDRDYPSMLKKQHAFLQSFKAFSPIITYPFVHNINSTGYRVGLANDHMCVFCKRTNMSNGRKSIIFIPAINNRDYVSTYDCCDDCNNQGLILCTNGYVEKSQCMHGMRPLLSLKKYIVKNNYPYDIFSYILSILLRVTCLHL